MKIDKGLRLAVMAALACGVLSTPGLARQEGKPAKKVNYVSVIKHKPAERIQRPHAVTSARTVKRNEGFRLSSLFDFSTRTSTPRRDERLYAHGRYLGKTIVTFRDKRFKPGTIYVNTAEKALYYILPGGKAIKYGVGVGRQGFTWKGRHRITMKKEWPEWRPPEEMKIREWKKYGRRLPDVMEGGPRNPLGARALYIGNTLYRIHGTNNPSTIGKNVSSGCIRMVNEEVIDLYNRVKIGAPVIVE